MAFILFFRVIVLLFVKWVEVINILCGNCVIIKVLFKYRDLKKDEEVIFMLLFFVCVFLVVKNRIDFLLKNFI